MTACDEEIMTAIKSCKPWRYLDDLKEHVASVTGEDANDREFGYRVYCLNRDMDHRKLVDRLDSEGWIRVTEKVLESMADKKVEVLRNIGGLTGERIETGTIKSNGRGGWLVLPPRCRTKGYYPSYIRMKVNELV